MSVTVPAGATVTVAGATPISNSVAIASGPLPTQFIATGLKSANQTIQPAPGTPLTLLQVMPCTLFFITINGSQLVIGLSKNYDVDLHSRESTQCRTLETYNTG